MYRLSKGKPEGGHQFESLLQLSSINRIKMVQLVVQQPDIPHFELNAQLRRAWDLHRGVGCEVLTAVLIWDITPCSPFKVNLRFKEINHLHHQCRRIIQTRNQSQAGSRQQPSAGFQQTTRRCFPENRTFLTSPNMFRCSCRICSDRKGMRTC